MQNIFKTRINKTKGYTLVETIIYTSILSMIAIVVVSMLFSFSRTYRTVMALRLAENSGIYSMERITRDIFGATSVDTGNSTFGSTPGVLTVVATTASNSTTTKFYVESGVLKVDVNGVYVGPLTSNNTVVTTLNFDYLNSGISKAVKIDLSVTATVGDAVKDKTYHSTILLRGSN